MPILKPSFPRLQRGHRLAQGLIGAWTFTEGSGLTAYDYAGSRHDGDLTGHAPSWTGGRAGHALSFNGSSSYIQVNDPVNPGTNALTIAAWINPTTSATFRRILQNMTNGQSGGTGYDVFLRNDNTVDFFIGDSGGATSFIGSASGAVSANVWGLLVCTKDSANNGRIYYNGKVIASGTLRTLGDSTKNLRIGVTTDLVQFFPGLIDDVRIYNRALSADEVALLYFGGYQEFRARPQLKLVSTTTTYTLTGPTSGTVGVASSNFTVTPSAALSGSDTVNLSDGGAGGTFTPSSLSFASGATAGQTFTYDAASAGTKSISATSATLGLTVSGSPISYTASAAVTAKYRRTLSALGTRTGSRQAA